MKLCTNKTHFVENLPIASLLERLQIFDDVPRADIDALEDVHLVGAHRVLLSVAHDVDHDIVIHFLHTDSN